MRLGPSLAPNRQRHRRRRTWSTPPTASRSSTRARRVSGATSAELDQHGPHRRRHPRRRAHPRRQRPHRLRRATPPRARRARLRARGRCRRARGEVSTKPEWGHFKIGPTTRFLWYAMRKRAHAHHARRRGRRGTRRRRARPPGLARHRAAGPLPRQHRDPRARGRRRVRRRCAHHPARAHGRIGPQPAPFTDDPEARSTRCSASSGSTRRGCCPATAPPGTAASTRPCARSRGAAAASGS